MHIYEYTAIKDGSQVSGSIKADSVGLALGVLEGLTVISIKGV